LPHGNGYCIRCLSLVYEESPSRISQHLAALALIGVKRECGNCGEETETFRLAAHTSEY